jgi:hypothetical protein
MTRLSPICASVLAAPVITRLTEHPERHFGDEQAFSAHLEKLGITLLKVNPDPVEIATEGAIWGSIKKPPLLSQDRGVCNL